MAHGSRIRETFLGCLAFIFGCAIVKLQRRIRGLLLPVGSTLCTERGLEYYTITLFSLETFLPALNFVGVFFKWKRGQF